MARVRSPAYPALSLPDAVDLIRKVHAAQQRTPEPREVVLRHMGYAGESGRSLKAISALIKYGFLEKHGDEGLRVSERAMAILYPESEADRVDALHEAANEPSLYVEIFDRWEGRPSEEGLKAFLIRKGFNVNSVDSVAQAFYATLDLVSGAGDSYTPRRVSKRDDPEEDAMPEQQEPKSGGLTFIQTMKRAQQENARNVTRPIFDFETVQINSVIDNRDDLTELIGRLEKLTVMLPPKIQN